MITKKDFLLFDKAECNTFLTSGLTNEDLGKIFRALCNDFVEENKRDSILDSFQSTFEKSYMQMLFSNQDARRDKYNKKCKTNRDNIRKRWEKAHPGETYPYEDNPEEAEAELAKLDKEKLNTSNTSNKDNPYKVHIQR